MSFFEYKVVPAPTTGRRRQRRVDGLDKYASTIADIMTELGLEGWDFVGAELLRERRRRFLVLICDVERTLLIFRRTARTRDLDRSAAAPESPAESATAPAQLAPVTPRRVTRPDLIEAVAAGARRIALPTETSPADESNGIARAVEVAKAAAARDAATTDPTRGDGPDDNGTRGVAAE